MRKGRDDGRGRGAACVLALWAAGVLAAGCGSPASHGDAATAFTNCDDLGEEFFAGMSKTSPEGVTMELVSAEPAPPANSDQNAWTVRLSDDAGVPLKGATVIVAPYMPQHGHGAPPILGLELDDGSYQLSPLYLKMTGLWEVTLKATPVGGTESRVMFRFCIPPR